ncbi:MAG: citrate transporter [Clostridia bacterium]|nr:citrate transporter [Clostridia bacterium]
MNHTPAAPHRPPIHAPHHHVRDLLHAILTFIRKNTVLTIAILLALITSIIVPPDSEYISYFDFRTLSCLFCTLAVICALKNIRFFTLIARRIVSLTGNMRSAILALVYITFIGSMLIANDMALLTFLPLGYILLSSTGCERYMAFTFIMQNIAANLGGMLTPFGNPQNLYLYSKFNIPNGRFMGIMLIPFCVSVLLITLCCLAIKKVPISLRDDTDISLPRGRTWLYLVLFAYSIAIVFRSVPYWTGLIIIPAILLFVDRDALKKVDYPLLLTFVCFFIFAGNMSRIDAISSLLSGLLDKNTLLVSALSCQVISNVPSAILLSQFTTNYPELLVGVNIGGAGTLIASLASLITFREFTSHQPQNTFKYVMLFSAFNFGFLIILIIVSTLFLQVFPLPFLS